MKRQTCVLHRLKKITFFKTRHALLCHKRGRTKGNLKEAVGAIQKLWIFYMERAQGKRFARMDVKKKYGIHPETVLLSLMTEGCTGKDQPRQPYPKTQKSSWRESPTLAQQLKESFTDLTIQQGSLTAQDSRPCRHPCLITTKDDPEWPQDQKTSVNLYIFVSSWSRL